MNFTKMHGLGNDYVYVNAFVERVDDPAGLARKISDRHRGIGGDGLILIHPSDKADVRMQMFNADGSEAEMCGNGIRCVAKYAFDHGLCRSNPLRVETLAGVLTLWLEVVGNSVQRVTVNMGRPTLELAQIPVDPAHLAGGAGPQTHRLVLSNGQALEAVFVSMGNPHAVIFVPDVQAVELEKLGPLVEHHPAFPRRINAHWVQINSPARSGSGDDPLAGRINAHWVQVNSPSELTMRTWERGSGITLACGTGACAVAVAAATTGRTGRQLLAHLPGGDLQLEWRDADNNVYMTGPAVEVFTGQWPDA